MVPGIATNGSSILTTKTNTWTYLDLQAVSCLEIPDSSGLGLLNPSFLVYTNNSRPIVVN